MIYTKATSHIWSVNKLINGSLAGLVSICAVVDDVEFYNALLIGIIAGVLYELGSIALLKLHMDDPVGTMAVLNVSVNTLCRCHPSALGRRAVGNDRVWTLSYKQ